MISLYNSQITDILPYNIKNSANAIAISYAMQRQNQKILNYAKRINILAAIDELPEQLVDLMAAEYRTQYYSEELSIDVKRKLVKNTMLWYMSAGTSACVEELVNTIFGYGKVEEWFDYNGTPYHFRISVDTILDQDKLIQFAKIIRKAKNARSIMDGFNKYNKPENTVYFASGMVRTKHIRIGGE